jgi:hypothetical protein
MPSCVGLASLCGPLTMMYFPVQPVSAVMVLCVVLGWVGETG